MYTSIKVLDPRGGTALDDSDGDGVPDTEDLCPNTPLGQQVNATGCENFTIIANNFTVEAIGETCPDKNNGQISISAVENFNYTVTIDSKKYNFTNSSALVVENLEPNTYNFCIEIVGETYEQCYAVTIEEGSIVSGKTTINSKIAEIKILDGTAPFNVFVNNELAFNTYSPEFLVPIKHGDVIDVKTAISCEGVYSKQINLFEELVAYPNPTQGAFEIALPTNKKEVTIEMYNMQSQLISSKTYPVLYGKVLLKLDNNPNGLYFAKVYLEDTKLLKIVKQ
jgi:hypothetical protein